MKTIYKILIAAFIFRIILAFIAWHPDLNNHVDWGIRFWQYGPGDFYDQNVWSFSWPNQPPGTILIFAAIRKLFEFIFAGFWWININLPIFPSNIMLFFEERLYQALLKLPAILADLGIAYIVYQFLKEKVKNKLAIWGATAFLFNPVIIYNSSIWGQTDATVNFFGLLSIFLLLKKKLTWALFALAISLFIKASLLIFIPVFLIVAICQKYNLKQWMQAIAISAGLVMVLTAPFSAGEPFSWLFNLYNDKVFGWQLHLITANAFNFWAALTGIHEQPDTLLFGPFNFKTWGYILFGTILTPLLLRVYRKQDLNTILWVVALTAFSSFVLLTGIHERYLYPLFPFLTIIAAFERKWLWALVTLSILHLVNLYNFWWYPRIETLVELLSALDRLLPRILGLVITLIFVWVYITFLKRKSMAG